MIMIGYLDIAVSEILPMSDMTYIITCMHRHHCMILHVTMTAAVCRDILVSISAYAIAVAVQG